MTKTGAGGPGRGAPPASRKRAATKREPASAVVSQATPTDTTPPPVETVATVLSSSFRWVVEGVTHIAHRGDTITAPTHVVERGRALNALA